MTLNAAQQARRDAVVALWRKGMSSGEIWKMLGAEYGIVSRCAVIGIVNRARERGDLKDKARRQAPIAKTRTKPSKTLASTGFVHAGTLPSSNASASPAPVRKPPRMDTHALDESARCSILDLHFNTRCKWIVGDPRTPFEAIYCGSENTEDCKPYCEYHDAVAHGRMVIEKIKDVA